MRGLRFWQKTYLLTLALFLVALFGSVAFMGWQNQQQTLASEVEKVRGEERFIAQALSQDLAALSEGNTHLRTSALVQSYGNHYAQNGILLALKQVDGAFYSNLPEGAEATLAPASEQQSWTIAEFNDESYLFVASVLPEDAGAYTLICARSLGSLYIALEGMRTTLVVGSALASILLATGLYFILRRLSKPLEQLAGTADAFAAGDYGARAEKRSDDEVGMLADSLNAMADAAERNLAEVQRIADQNARMAANLSHEIRTPLTAVIGYVDYLRMADATDAERMSALSVIAEQSIRMQAISQRMLQLAALDHDEIPLARADLADIARRALRATLPASREAGVKLHVSTPLPVFIKGDTVLLESLVANLLDNAVKACDAGGSVQLCVGCTLASATLSIADNGRGLTPDELERLGEPFYRPDKARSRAAGGAGLGAALCLEIARLHNAELTYRSQLGKGTTATVIFTTS